MKLSYKEALSYRTFEDRFNYLKLNGSVAERTFGGDRYLNQILYRSYEWKKLRDEIIFRDGGCDLALPGFEIPEVIYIHHINPITVEQIENADDAIFDPDNLICVSYRTHLDLHYSSYSRDRYGVERCKNDTIPWRN